ncbi:MAG: PEP-CTERM sorting domain-containing protein [Gemmatales bacterium]
MRWKSLVAGIVAACSLTAVHADNVPVVVFSDSFVTETSTYNPVGNAWGNLNFNNFSNWNVTRGTVDLVNLNGQSRSLWFSHYSGASPSFSFVDLDGTSVSSGTITSKNALNLAPGNYRLSFDATGNLTRKPNSEGLTVRLDGLGISQHYELASDQGFETKNIDFTVTTPTSTTISFSNESDDPTTLNDNEGAMVANINLTNLSAGIANVPEPGTMVIGAGLLAGIYLARRFRRQPVTTA